MGCNEIIGLDDGIVLKNRGLGPSALQRIREALLENSDGTFSQKKIENLVTIIGLALALSGISICAFNVLFSVIIVSVGALAALISILSRAFSLCFPTYTFFEMHVARKFVEEISYNSYSHTAIYSISLPGKESENFTMHFKENNCTSELSDMFSRYITEGKSVEKMVFNPKKKQLSFVLEDKATITKQLS